jgi:hypothetical protein
LLRRADRLGKRDPDGSRALLGLRDISNPYRSIAVMVAEEISAAFAKASQ